MNSIVSLSTVVFLLGLTEARRHHNGLHYDGRRAILARSTTPNYTSVYSNTKTVPSFDDCVNYDVVAATTSTEAASKCADVAFKSDASAKFFAVYKTVNLDSSIFWCGWWDTKATAADATDTKQDGDGDAITSAWGFNFAAVAASSTTSLASTESPNSATTLKVSTTLKTTSATKASSTTLKVPSGTTTVTSTATATGLAGFTFVYGGIPAIPATNVINYWVADSDWSAEAPQIKCSEHCNAEISCKGLALWVQPDGSFNCAIYSAAISLAKLKTSNKTSIDNSPIGEAMAFNKGKDTNLNLKYTFETPRCGMPGYIWPDNVYASGTLDNIDDLATCAALCKSKADCKSYEWMPSSSRCQTWTQDFSAIVNYDPTSLVFWYAADCDISKAIGPTFRNTRLTADQKKKYCGIKGTYTGVSHNTYQPPNTASADDCGKWCSVYPVFMSYRWNSAKGTCICQSPSIGSAVAADSSSTDLFYAMDCYSKTTYMYTNMQVL